MRKGERRELRGIDVVNENRERGNSDSEMRERRDKKEERVGTREESGNERREC